MGLVRQNLEPEQEMQKEYKSDQAAAWTLASQLVAKRQTGQGHTSVWLTASSHTTSMTCVIKTYRR